MAPHSSTLAWKIPWTEEPGGLQSMGSLRVGHGWATSLSLFTFHFPALEKEMATHSSVLAWRIPGTGEPGGLPSYGVAQSRTRLKRLSSSSSSVSFSVICLAYLKNLGINRCCIECKIQACVGLLPLDISPGSNDSIFCFTQHDI